MDSSLLLAAKIAASACIGLLIGLEREWARKDVGVRSFTIAALLGTVSWLVSPTLAYIQVAVIIVIGLLVNIFAAWKDHDLQVTTTIALAVTNTLGIIVGMGNFFLAFTCAIVITALLSWKTELVTFASKLTVEEIRGALLMGFITAIVYPLLPDRYIDPWKILNPRSVWLTVVIVSGLNFINYVLLRQFGTRGIRFSAVLGGLVNSAATSAILGQEEQRMPETAPGMPANILLADLAMILRNIALVVIFAIPAGLRASLPTAAVLAPMLLISGIVALLLALRERSSKQGGQKEKQQQERKSEDAEGQHEDKEEHTQGSAEQEERKPMLRSPLSLRSVLGFGLLFLLLTVVSGLAQHFFGALGFLVVIVVGALASAASSSVLVGKQLQTNALGAGPAAIAMFLATLVGLVENAVIFWVVTRKMGTGLRLLLLTLPLLLGGALVIGAALLLGWH